MPRNRDGGDPLDDRDWQHRVVHCDVGLDPFSHQPPCRPKKRLPSRRSLVEQSLDAVRDNVGALSPASLAQLPPKQLEKLARLLLEDNVPWNTKQQLTLHVWKLLMPAYMAAQMSPRVPEDQHKAVSVSEQLRPHGQVFVAHMENPRSPLAVYLEQLRPLPSPVPEAQFPTAFLVHLRILTDIQQDGFRTNELLKLATLPNLAVLEILERPKGPIDKNWGDDPLRADDRLLRSWSCMPNAFPALTVLVLHRHRDERLTLAALEYVTRFPALAFFSASLRNPSGTRDGDSKDQVWSDIKYVRRGLGWAPCRITPGRESGDLYDLQGAKQSYHLVASARQSDNGEPEAYDSNSIPMPVLAAHWALRLNAFLTGASGGYNDDMLRELEFARKPVDAYAHMDADDPVTHQPMLSLTLGTDKPARNLLFNSTEYAFARKRGAAAQVSKSAFKLTGAANRSRAAAGSNAAYDAPSELRPPQLRKRKHSTLQLLARDYGYEP